MKPVRIALIAIVVLAMPLLAWRIVAHTVADGLAATGQDMQALHWMPGHPAALLHNAERAAKAGHPVEAAAWARALLAREPLEARAMQILAASEVAQGRKDDGRALYRQTLRMSPRNVDARAWLIQDSLERSDVVAAAADFDALLTFAPAMGHQLMPVMANLAQDPRFADALGSRLAQRPAWRSGFLATLQQGKYPHGERRVLSYLRAHSGLSRQEVDQWIDALTARGEWGEAYARWVSSFPPGTSPGLVHDPEFVQMPGNRGFEWRLRRLPGVRVEFVPAGRGGSLAAHAVFAGRPAAELGLEQMLMLAPGRYRLEARMRADALASDRGLAWTLECLPAGTMLDVGDRLDGTFAWKIVSGAIEIPPAGCAAQRLRLVNPVPAGPGQIVRGELWVDSVNIARLHAAATSSTDNVET